MAFKNRRKSETFLSPAPNLPQPVAPMGRGLEVDGKQKMIEQLFPLENEDPALCV